MATVTMTERATMVYGEKTRLSWMERYMVRRMHPAAIFAEVAGIIWFVHFLWLHLWPEAVAAVIVTRALTLTMTRNVDTSALANTAIGKIALLHLEPLNLAIQLIGAFGAVYGIWTHETKVILAASSVILLGHMRGWASVDRGFRL